MRPRSVVAAGAALAALIAVVVAARAPVDRPAPTTSSPEAVELMIYAAASLKGAIEQARDAYEAANPGIRLILSTDSSSALATQIEQGAPADVFLSADSSNPQMLVDAQLAEGEAVTFAQNELAIIVPKANPAAIQSPADLARPGITIIAAGNAVPITGYAARLIADLAKEAGYPADFVAAYAANVASREDNVKAVVAKIELAEGDAGIVYVTDARASTEVKSIDIPTAVNVRATYDGLVIRSSGDPAAKAFLEWLAGPGGQAHLGAFGFLAPS